MAKKPAASGFNTPFRNLKPSKGAAPPAGAPAPAAKAAALPPPPPQPPPPKATAVDDDRLFEQAMRGVTPLSATQRNQRAASLAAPPRPVDRAAARGQARRDEAIADADLSELVARPGRLTVEEVGESVSAWADGVDRRLLRRLLAGDYAIDGDVDLHGLGRDAASASLERAVRRAHADGKRCLLVIHGRGLNSGDDGPVLKKMVIEALGGSALGRLVLAFASAPPALGGTGAVVVLLRKLRG